MIFANPKQHFQIGKDLQALREQGVLLIGSANIVHNLRRVDLRLCDNGYDWASQFDDYIKDNIIQKNYDNVLDYQSLGKVAELAVPTPDHFNPILYLLGASNQDDEISVYSNGCLWGCLSITSYLFK